MSYEDELRAKLDAVRPAKEETGKKLDLSTLETQILEELDAEFNFSQYDLQESDILRALKIQEILQSYPEAFAHPQALKLFYVLSRIDVITPQKLYNYLEIPQDAFKSIINAMAKANLLFKNSEQELELSLNGKSLAARIGVDIFI